MSIKDIHKTVLKADGILWFAGWIQIFIGLACLCTAPWDQRAEGVYVLWLKPAKYAAANVLYCWTMAWLLRYLREPKWAKRLIRWGVFLSLPTALGSMIVQAGRGVVSHWGVAEPFDASMLIALVASLLCNALLAFVLMFHLLWQDIELPGAYLGGIVTGLALFILGCGVGVYALLQFHNAANAAATPPDLRLLHVGLMSGLTLAPWIGHLLSRAETRPAVAEQRP